MTTQEHLTEYERAIYYYTLPRIQTPFPVGVTVLYAFAMLVAGSTIVYGVSTEQPDWLRAGGIGLAFGVVVGVGTFLLRDFQNQLRERSALATAKSMPDADSQFDDIPDPFGEHVLLRYPIRHQGSSLTLEDNKGNSVFIATLSDGGKKLTMSGVEDQPQFTAQLDSRSHSFSFETGSPSRVKVEKGGVSTATVHRHSNFGPATVDIECHGENARNYQYRGGGLFLGEALVGRIYEVRQYHYLDIEKQHFTDGIMSFFVTIG